MRWPSVLDEVAALDPEDRQMWIELRGPSARQSVDIDDRKLAFKIGERGELQRKADIFGVPRLRGFHQRRGLRRGDVDAFAVEHGARPGVGPANHDDGDAGAVQTREIGDACDAERRGEALHSRNGLLRRETPIEGSTAGPGTQAGVARSANLPHSRAAPAFLPCHGRLIRGLQLPFMLLGLSILGSTTKRRVGARRGS